MPAWPSWPPRTRPGWLISNSTSPEEKIQRITLPWVMGVIPVHVRAFQELVVAHQPAGKRQSRKLRITAYVEINPSIIEIGIATLQKPLNEPSHGPLLLTPTTQLI